MKTLGKPGLRAPPAAMPAPPVKPAWNRVGFAYRIIAPSAAARCPVKVTYIILVV